MILTSPLKNKTIARLTFTGEPFLNFAQIKMNKIAKIVHSPNFRSFFKKVLTNLLDASIMLVQLADANQLLIN